MHNWLGMHVLVESFHIFKEISFHSIVKLTVLIKVAEHIRNLLDKLRVQGRSDSELLRLKSQTLYDHVWVYSANKSCAQ